MKGVTSFSYLGEHIYTIPFPSEFRRNECQFRLNKIENRRSFTKIRSRDLNFHLGKVQFHFSEIDMDKV